MVAAEEDMGRVTQFGGQSALDESHLHGHLLQHAQRALGFVEVVDFVLDGVDKSPLSSLPPVRGGGAWRGDGVVAFHSNWYAAHHEDNLVGTGGPTANTMSFFS